MQMQNRRSHPDIVTQRPRISPIGPDFGRSRNHDVSRGARPRNRAGLTLLPRLTFRSGRVARNGAGAEMGINKESDIAANLQIGPTSLGMVRIYVEAEGVDLPLDFDPDEAEEISAELMAAAEAARGMGRPKGKPRKG